MLTRREQDRHEKLILQCMDIFNGSPEQFGSLLYTATQTICHWGISGPLQDTIHKWAKEKHFARRQIAGMKDGAELLRLEEKSLK